MRNWMKTRGLMLAAWLILSGLGWVAVVNYSWVANWWAAIGLTAFGILAALLAWRGMNNAGWHRKVKAS